MIAYPKLLTGSLLSCALLAASLSAASAEGTDYSRYFKSSSALSAVASAVSILEPCEKPIKFEETKDGSTLKLKMTCPATEGDAIVVELTFQTDDAGNLFPDSFDYGN
ncbi:MAG: hypothetical protein RIC14_09060 [Filomicrobium sp.]